MRAMRGAESRVTIEDKSKYLIVVKLQRIVVVIGNLYVCNARMTDVWLIGIASPLIGFVGGLRGALSRRRARALWSHKWASL